MHCSRNVFPRGVVRIILALTTHSSHSTGRPPPINFGNTEIGFFTLHIAIFADSYCQAHYGLVPALGGIVDWTVPDAVGVSAGCASAAALTSTVWYCGYCGSVGGVYRSALENQSARPLIL